MVWVNLWPSRPPLGLHGIVHRSCSAARERREPSKWRQSANEQAADVDFPGYTLYWCSWSACFGPNNPRRFPRD